ncbi:MAG: glycosyltransferase family 8 protein [Saprospiraceae bacterium]|nr:glycosyltransferase family 8 protein [Saprospiraceae bacterium]
MSSETISIVVTIDDKYVQHCAVMLTSLFTFNRHLDFKIYVIYDTIRLKNHKRLQLTVEKYGYSVLFIQNNNQVFEEAFISDHISKATYLRLLIPDLVPQMLKKVLFLDADIIVRSKIDDLWHINIDNYSHAAVENPLITEAFKESLGMQGKSFYFNAGVLLINLAYWRNNSITEKSIWFLKNHIEKIIYWDQDILNVLLENQWRVAPTTWNAQEAIFTKKVSCFDLNIPEEIFGELQKNPCIIHFTGSDKPWFIENTHPFKEEYYEYLTLTYWKSYKPISRKPSFKQRVHRKILKGLNFFKIVNIRELCFKHLFYS